MNKIVREHYPVEKLPEDLKVGFRDGATVRIVLEIDSVAQHGSLPGFADLETESDRPPMTAKDLADAIERYHQTARPTVSLDEAVARIRQLRDEWDD